MSMLTFRFFLVSFSLFFLFLSYLVDPEIQYPLDAEEITFLLIIEGLIYLMILHCSY